MNTRVVLGAIGLAGATVLIGQMSVDAVPDRDENTNNSIITGQVGEASGDCQWQDPPSDGPDVIPGDLQSTRRWATNETETAYSIGTTSCNLGDATLDWAGAPNHNHPVISQNMFRVDTNDGRIYHIGQAWLKHSFCALQQFICGSCNGGGGCQSVLHPCCSDPYTANRNGGQIGLGPKWEVNAHTGQFTLPWHQGEGTSGSFRRRMRVANADLEAGGKYFIEGMYIAKDDAAANNQNNNASYRSVSVGSAENNYPLSVSGSTFRGQPGINAWRSRVPGVTLVDVQIDEDGVADPLFEDGLMILGYIAIDNLDGTWTYNYAVQNLHSNRSGRSFTVDVPSGIEVTDLGFSDVVYHSGDGINGVNRDGTDWTMARNAADVTWEIAPGAGDDANANALRWATLYSFWFTADAEPTAGNATIGLFLADKNNPNFNDISRTVDVPLGAECSAGGDVTHDGCVDFEDILLTLANWGGAGPDGDADCSGTVDFEDILMELGEWGDGCP